MNLCELEAKPSLQCEFQDSQDCLTGKRCRKKKKERKKEKGVLFSFFLRTGSQNSEVPVSTEAAKQIYTISVELQSQTLAPSWLHSQTVRSKLEKYLRAKGGSPSWTDLQSPRTTIDC